MKIGPNPIPLVSSYKGETWTHRDNSCVYKGKIDHPSWGSVLVLVSCRYADDCLLCVPTSEDLSPFTSYGLYRQNIFKIFLEINLYYNVEYAFQNYSCPKTFQLKF